MKKKTETLGERIKRIRLSRKPRLSQEAAAARGGMKQSHWSAIERGTKPNIQVKTLEKIAAGLGVTVGELTD